jgi:hypothetical protein
MDTKPANPVGDRNRTVANNVCELGGSISKAITTLEEPSGKETWMVTGFGGTTKGKPFTDNVTSVRPVLYRTLGDTETITSCPSSMCTDALDDDLQLQKSVTIP